jgi:GDP-L-fucose synthase
LDNTKISSLGWKPEIELEAGIASTYDWFLSNSKKEQTA